MDSFEANKIFGAVLGSVFVLFGGSLLAEAIFHSEAPEKPGFAITAAEPAAGGAAAPAANEVTPVGQIMQTASAENGAAIFKRCQACHSGEKGGPNKVGPDLWDIVNRPIASHEGFSYSAAMTEFSQGKTVVWDWDHLNHFLHGPKQYIKGTAMGFAGIAKDQERADLLAYLGTLSDNPPAPPAPDAGASEAAAPAEGAAPAAGDAAAPAQTNPATTTNTGTLGSDTVTQPQSGGTTDATTGATPTTPPSGAVPTTGDNATSAPPQAPSPAEAQNPGAAPAAPAPAAPAPDAATPAAPAPAAPAPAPAQ
ncbi:c-type cytochrome [Aureimonas ureilytica]|uniref:c-type cytochrome n=1 Tax=Aureimonas ureilytica TaxID=401562 RepID=UPI00037F1F2E|nr:c-type cytochrome [Aureimonas ureilytica]